jgi:WD40 repeat protein
MDRHSMRRHSMRRRCVAGYAARILPVAVAAMLSLLVVVAASAGAAESLAPVAGSPFSTGGGSRPGGVAFSPSGGLLAEANTGNSTVSLFTLNNSGWAGGSAVPTVNGYSGPGAANSVAFSPDGKLLATADSGYGVSLFTVEGSTLAPVNGSPYGGGSGIAGSVAFSPDGTLVATANTTSSSVSLFTVGASGLTAVAGSPFPTGAINAASVAFGPSGALLATANQGSNNVSLFTVSESGLTPVSGSPYPTGTASQPSSVAFSPDGTLLASANYGYVSGPNGVSLFTVGSTGLTPAAGSPYATGANSGPYSVAFSPGGNLLATADTTSGNVSMFTVAASTLTPLAGSPYPTGLGPRSVAFDPSGALLASANYFGDNVSLFSLSEPSPPGPKPPLEPGPKPTPGPPSGTPPGGTHTSTITQAPPGTITTSGKVSSSGVQSVTIYNLTDVPELAGLIESFNCPIPLWGSCGNTYTLAASAGMHMALSARKHKPKVRIISVATAHATIPPHGRLTIKLKLSRTARRLLRSRHLRVTLRTTFTAAGQSASVTTRSVLLHR